MLTALQDSLRPTRVRWIRQRGWQAMATGMLLGSVGSLGVVLARRWGWVFPVGLEFVFPLVMGSVGCVSPRLKPPSWESVARLIDARNGLKDRAITAWQFAHETPLVGLERLQVEDAVSRLRQVEPSKIIPRRTPTRLGSAMGLWLTAMVAAALPEPQAAVPDPVEQRSRDAVNRQVAEQLEATLLEELKQLAELTETPTHPLMSFKELPQNVADQLRHLKLPGQTRSEALMTLSEIQAAIGAASRQLHDDAALAHLQELATALGSAESLEGVSDALKKGEFDRAAAQVRQLDPQKMNELERQTLAESLKPLVEKWREAQDEDLASAAGPLQESLVQGDADRMRDAAERLAAVLNQQALQMAIEAKLGAQLDQLSEAKGVARSGGDNIARSNESRATWGRGRAGDPLSGETREIETTRQREELTGIQGDGPTDRQTMRVEANEGQAERPLTSAFRGYEQSAEEVLQRENFPLGYRKTIREYFRSIRPE